MKDGKGRKKSVRRSLAGEPPKKVVRALAELTPHERIVLRQRLNIDDPEKLTLDEIRQRIEEIEERALRKFGGFRR